MKEPMSMKTWKYGSIYSVSLKVVLAGVAIREARRTEVGTQPTLAAECRTKGEEMYGGQGDQSGGCLYIVHERWQQ